MTVLLSIFTGPRPDITPIQALAVLVLALSFAGVIVLDATETAALLSFALGDSVLRSARNLKDGKVEAAAVSAPVEPHDVALGGTEDEDTMPPSEDEIADALAEGETEHHPV